MEYSDQPNRNQANAGNIVPPVGVFVSARQAEALNEQIDAATRILLLIRGGDPAEPIPFEKLGGLAVAVVEVDPADRRSVDRIVSLVRSKPAYPVIAAIAATDMGLVRTLVREGVSDFVSLPLHVAELTQACLDAIARLAKPATRVKLAPMISIVRSTGGCGATTVATQLSGAISRQLSSSRKVLLADLDLQYGSAATYLQVERAGSIPDLIASEERLDEELLRALAPQTSAGMALLSIPSSLPSSDSIPMDGLLRVFEALRTNYGLVVVDLPPNWSNWSASLAFASDVVLLVTELSFNSIRVARRCIDLFDVIGVPSDKVQIVVNKVEKKLFRPIDTGDVARTLGRTVVASLPRDAGDLAKAQDQGALVADVAKRNAFASGIDDLARAVIEKLGLQGNG